jgi:hypothetical protein
MSDQFRAWTNKLYYKKKKKKKKDEEEKYICECSSLSLHRTLAAISG